MQFLNHLLLSDVLLGDSLVDSWTEGSVIPSKLSESRSSPGPSDYHHAWLLDDVPFIKCCFLDARCAQNTHLPESLTNVSPAQRELFHKSSVMFLSKYEAFSLDESSWSSWTTSGRPLKGQHHSQFSLAVDNGWPRFAGDQYLGNGFLILSRLIDFAHFASQLLSSLFGSWPEVFRLRSCTGAFSLWQTGYLKWILYWTGLGLSSRLEQTGAFQIMWLITV